MTILLDRKSKLSEYDSVEHGPIETFVSSSRPSTVISSSDDDSSFEDDDEFVVDDDIVDGKRITKPLASVELPGNHSTDLRKDYL